MNDSGYRQTVTRTIRMSPDLDQALQKLAKSERVSTNLVVNQAIRRFTEWEAIAERYGFITIPEFLHARLYSYLSEEEARELGEWAANNFGKDFVLFWFKKMSFDTVLDALRLLGSKYARIFNLEHSFDGRVHTVVLKHGWGQKGSVFNEQFLRTVFRSLLNLDTESERSEEQVVVRVTPYRDLRKPASRSDERRHSVKSVF